MEALLDEIVRRAAAGERLALCTVVETRGSTPQRRGAKMIVTAAGQTVGTLGGGCVEAEVRKRAVEQLDRGGAQLMRFSLDHDYGWDDGLICGGVMQVFVQVVDACAAGQFARLLEALRSGQSTTWRFEYEQDGRLREYAEDLGPPPRLVIAGAGHVGQALARVAAVLDFDVTVIDDRPDFASAERFPTAKNVIVGDIESTLRGLTIDTSTYLVLVTRGHRHDGAALAAVVNSDARYVGLIGSKTKVKMIFDDLLRQGVSEAVLRKVRAPVGLDLSALTVGEIAVSIAAEIVAVRREADVSSIRPMKFPDEELQRWATGHAKRQ